MLKYKIFMTAICCFVCSGSAFANATLGSITQQRAILEDLNLKVQIEEQSKKLNQLLMPTVVPVVNPNSTKELIDKLETPEDEDGMQKNSAGTASKRSSKSDGIIAIHSNSKILKATVRIKGKSHTLTNGQLFERQKVQITRDKVIIGNKTLEL